MKSLNTIQTLAKVGKIFSKIIYICCIVGFAGCAVSTLAMLVGAETLKIGGVTIESFLKTEAGIGEGTIPAAIAVGMILCVGEFFVSRMSYRYFDNELKVGTPFTYEGARKLMQLGISAIWIPIVSSILAEIAQGVIAQFAETEKLSLDGFDSAGTGIMLIIGALLCRYGAEVRENGESNSR